MKLNLELKYTIVLAGGTRRKVFKLYGRHNMHSSFSLLSGLMIRELERIGTGLRWVGLFLWDSLGF
jgi:hypothetical protein